MDLVLVNPNNRIISPFAGVEPPLWAGLIANDQRGKGKEVAILDAEALNLMPEETAKEVKSLNPSEVIVVVMGNNPSVSSTPKMIATKALVKLLRDIPVSVTGLHPSALPRETVEELKVSVITGKMFDGMPDMPWDLLPMDKYIAHNWHCLDGSSRSPYASVYTSLGCPFSCSFCNIHALYGGQHKVWYREPRAILQEIDRLVNEYKVRNIKFWDELFTLNQKHIEDICSKLIRRHYNLNIWTYARVDTVTPDMLNLMKTAGINWLCYGFEAGNSAVLSKIGKKATIGKAIKAVDMTHEAEISIIGNFIFGLPGDTEETMQETLNFAKSLELEYANFYVAKAYPGSPIYKGNTDWASYSQFEEDNSKVREFRDKAFLEFFIDKDYLDRIEHKFGKQAVKQIGKMLEFGKPVTRSS